MKKTILIAKIPIDHPEILKQMSGVFQVTIEHHGPFGKKEPVTRVNINPFDCTIKEIEEEIPEVEQDETS